MRDTAHAAKLTPLPQVECVPVLDRDAATRNARRNLRLKIPRFAGLPEVGKVKHSPIALVGGGPSLRATLAELKGFRTVMVCASAHDYLVENGVLPRYAVVMDPLAKDNLKYFRFRVDTCTYLVASHVEHAVLAQFDGYPVALWNLMGDADPKVFGDELQIMGGPTAFLRAQIMAMYLGYGDQHAFGIDSCYDPVVGSHAYPVEEEMPPAYHIKVQNGREFLTTPPWVAQAQWFFKAIGATQGAFHTTIHGDGLIAEMARKGNPEFLKAVTLA